MRSFLDDLRYGLRGLLARPGFTVAALAALSLGIAANTAIFSLVDAVVLRPLPYADPERLVMLWETNVPQDLSRERLSPVNFLDYRGLDQVFVDAAAWWHPEINLTDDRGDPVRATAVETSSNLFAVLGVTPQLGTGFAPGPLDGSGGDEPQVVLSDRLWRSRYGGDPGIVGRALRLNGTPHTVVGVMRPGFGFPGETDLWQRLSWDLSHHSRHAHFMEAVARLRPGVDRARAQDEIAALAGRLAAQFPDSNKDWGARSVALQTEVVGEVAPALLVLFAAVGLLLLLACANVANLLLARASARRREVALRAALGAGRARLLRQFLTESLVLAGLAAAVGVALAWAAVRLLVAANPIDLPRLAEAGLAGRVVPFAGLDGRTLGFSLAATLATALLFGLVPALQLSAADLQGSLQRGGRGGGGGGAASGRRTRGALVVAEVAIAALLLVGSALLVRSFLRLLEERPGFTAGSAVTVNLELPRSLYADWSQVSGFYSRLLERLAASPGVRSAGATGFLPLEQGWRIDYSVPGQPPPAAGDEPTAQYVTVSDGYFETLGIPLVEGRAFDRRDAADSPAVVVINRELSRRAFPGVHAVGRLLTPASGGIGPLGRAVVAGPDYRVVGVVGDVKNDSLARSAEPVVYFAQTQFPYRNMSVVVRGAGTPAALVARVREEVRRLDPTLALAHPRTLDDLLAAATARPRFLAWLMGAFAGLALLLAAVGIYGVLSYAVAQRRGEIGVRMALGAAPADVRRLVVGEGMVLAGLGLAIGVLAALGLARLLAGLLFGVAASDGPAFAAAATVILAAAFVACYLPAHRAATVSPLEALRSE